MLSDAGLRALALKTLSRDEDDTGTISPHYLQELRRFLEKHPHDNIFIVSLGEGNGYGTVTCLEDACFMDVVLDAHPDVALGGKNEGFGQFGKYEDHCNSHSGHKQCVAERAKAEPPRGKPRPSQSSQHSSFSSSASSSASSSRRTLVAITPGKRRPPVPHPAQSPARRSYPSPFSSKSPSFTIPTSLCGSSFSSKPSKFALRTSYPVTPRNAALPPSRARNDSREESFIAAGDDASSNTMLILSPAATPQKVGPKRTFEIDSDDEVEVGPSAKKVAVQSDAANSSPIPSPVEQIKPLQYGHPMDAITLQANKDAARSEYAQNSAEIARLSRSTTDVHLRRAAVDRLAHRNAWLLKVRMTGIVRAPYVLKQGGPPQLKMSAAEKRKEEEQALRGGFPVPAAWAKTEPAVAGPSRSTGPGIPALAGTVLDQLERYEAYDPQRIVTGSNPPTAAAAELRSQAWMDQIAAQQRLDAEARKRARAGLEDDEDLALAMPTHRTKDELSDFYQSAINDFASNATVNDSATEIGLASRDDKIEGLRIQLLPHQLIGVAWMLKQERDPKKAKGGILADDMGLGKTVQMLATCVLNRSDDPKRKTTLIIAPLALLDQWRSEIKNKTEKGLFKVYVHHGQNKLKTVKEISRYDFVLTTYGTLVSEIPQEKKKGKNKPKKKAPFATDSEEDSDGFIEHDSEEEEEERKKKRGPLARFEWYRVILDEAQNIRNRNTRASKSVIELDSIYRWCLTGTPITNTLTDVYSLLRFIRLRKWEDWTEFNDRIGKKEKKNAELATKRLQAILRTCFFRRLKNATLDGKPLVSLPEKHIYEELLEFSDAEREIYNFVQARSQAVFNRYLKQGTVLKNYATVLAMLTRLRQCCSHPHLIKAEKGGFNAEDLEFTAESTGLNHEQAQSEIARATKVMSAELINKVKDRFAKRAEMLENPDDEGIDEDELACPICFEPVSDEVVTVCGHSFCHGCLDEIFNTPLHIVMGGHDVDDGGISGDDRPCPMCRSKLKKNELFKGSAFEPEVKKRRMDLDKDEIGELDSDGDEEMPDVSDVLDKAQRKKKSKAINLDSEGSDDDAFAGDKAGKGKGKIVLSDDSSGDAQPKGKGKQPSDASGLRKDDLEEKPLPSTKQLRLLELLEQWAVDLPDEKTIIVSGFVSMLDLVADLLMDKGVKFVRYDGKMSKNARNDAVADFMEADDSSVMLLSLKSGGVGLNLTRANRMINLDLAWNAASEDQCRDRIHRIGQAKEVFNHRLMIADTIEQRMFALQEQKKALSDGALGEGKGAKLGRLNVEDLKMLFGF